VAAFALGIAVRERGLWRVLGVATTLLCIAVLPQTGSRGSSIGFAVTVFLFAIGQAGRIRAILAVGMCVGVVALWSTAPASFRDRMMMVGDSESDYNITASQGRVQIWKRGLGYLAARPIFGVGVGNFETADGEYLRANGIGGKWSAPHNSYVESFVELGVVGGCIFLYLTFRGLRVAWTLTSMAKRTSRLRAPPLRPEIFAALAGIAVSGMFLGFAYFWALFALWGLVSLAEGIVD
jgi:O-antigen ligase